MTASVTGKVGSTQTVNIPTVDGYTASQSSVSVVIAPTGMTTDTITYTLNNTPWNYTVTLTDGTTQKVTGSNNSEGTPSKVGDKVTVTAPAVKGYDTPSASGTVQSDGSVKLDSGQSLNYVGNPVDNLSSKVSSNLGDQTVNNISGKVGDKITVDTPTVDGYTPDKKQITFTITPEGTATTTDTITYTGIKQDWNYPITLPDGTTQKVTGTTNNEGTPSKVGDKVTITAPAVNGYKTPSFTGTVQTDGSVKLDPNQNTNYVGNTVDNGTATIKTPVGDKTVDGIKGNVGDTVNVTLPDVDGYNHPTTAPGVIGPDGKVTVDPKDATYTGNTVKNGTATIPVTKDGQASTLPVTGINGTVGQTITIDVPNVPGYTSNKKTIQAVINSDHSISTTDKIVLTRIPSGTGSGTTTDPNVAGSNPDNANGSAVAIQMDVATYKDQPEVQVYTFSSDNKASEYSRKLGKDTAWYVDQKVSIDGILYYRVATNEYVKASDVYPYEDANLTIETRDRTSKTLYSAEGNVVTNRSLSAISDWFTDRTITINGEKYYRVASNEFVKASDVNPYQAIHSYVRVNGSTGSTQLYDTQGNAVTNRKVTAQSAWYTDQLVNINGTLYYRIATDEFIKADDVTVY